MRVDLVSDAKKNEETLQKCFDNLAHNIADNITRDREDLVKSFKSYMEKQLSQDVVNDIKNNVPAIIDEYVNATYGPIKRNVELIINSETVKIDNQIYHKEFDKVINCVNQNVPVYLYGESGTGKNVLAQQVAKALNIDFYYTNCVTDEFQLKGFTDATGQYRESEFYKAFKNGGVFMLDELDASVPETLIILNAAISNGYFDFPSPVGRVEASEGFRIIAAGNTMGYGSNEKYTGRNIIDLASLDRFLFINIDYDKNIERSICNDEELVNFIRSIRSVMKENELPQVISYRSLIYYTKMKSIISDKAELFRKTIFKNFSKSSFNSLYGYCGSINHNSKYYKYFEDVFSLLDREE